MSEFSMRNLGLTTAEAAALIAAAQARESEVRAHLSDYEIKDESRANPAFKKALEQQKISVNECFDLMVLRNLCFAYPDHLAPFPTRRAVDEETGFFTMHESFACMSNHVTQSNDPTFVGTPTLDGHMVNLRFHLAELKEDGCGTDEPRLREARRLTELNLSSGQFAALMRNGNAGSPCALGRTPYDLIDKPPRLIDTFTIAEKARTEARAIIAPLLTATKALRERLGAADKISTKSDYAELEQLANDVQAAMNEVRAPLRELLSRTASLMAESSTNQLMAEIAEPLKLLGMNQGEILQLMKL